MQSELDDFSYGIASRQAAKESTAPGSCCDELAQLRFALFSCCLLMLRLYHDCCEHNEVFNKLNGLAHAGTNQSRER